MRIGVFCLVRGGASVFSYANLIARNWSLKRNLKPNKHQAVSYLIFHEGNVTRLHRSVIKILSPIPLSFVDVGAEFVGFPNQRTDPSASAAGYSLMCRFMYLQIWKYLEHCDLGVRVDDDCRVVALPLELSEEDSFKAGVLLRDSHEGTNASLPAVLRGLGAEDFDDEFVANTCVFITRVSFWTDPAVSRFLQQIGHHDLALEKRWGDHRILGIALRKFGKTTEAAQLIDPRIDYFHGSHNHRVRGGHHERWKISRPSFNQYRGVQKMDAFFYRNFRRFRDLWS